MSESAFRNLTELAEQMSLVGIRAPRPPVEFVLVFVVQILLVAALRFIADVVTKDERFQSGKDPIAIRSSAHSGGNVSNEPITPFFSQEISFFIRTDLPQTHNDVMESDSRRDHLDSRRYAKSSIVAASPDAARASYFVKRLLVE